MDNFAQDGILSFENSNISKSGILYTDFLESLPIAAYTCDADGYLQLYNRAAAVLFGREPQPGVDRWCAAWKVFLPDGHIPPTEDYPLAVALRESTQSYGQQLIIERPDGERRVVMPYPRPIVDAAGQITGGINFIVDITQQQQAASELAIANLHRQQLIANVPAAIFTCDLQGRIQLYNQAAVELWGQQPTANSNMYDNFYRVKDIDGNLLPPEEWPIAKTLREGKRVAARELILERLSDGMAFTVRSNPQPLFDTAGTLYGVLNLMIDITEQSRTSEQLNRLAAIVTSSDDAIVSKTLDGIITSWNTAAERMFGYTAEEIIGKSITTIIPTERLQEETVIQQRLKKGERIDHFETKRVTKDGKILDISLTVSPVKNNFDRIIGASKIIRDITLQKEAELRLREGDALFRMAVESTRLGSWEYIAEQALFTWSEESRRIWGFPSDIAVSYHILLQQVHPEDLGQLKRNAIIAMDAAQGGHYHAEFRIFHYRDHQLRWLKAQGKVFFTAEGKVERFIGTVLDITEEKLSRESLEKTVQERTAALIAMNEELQRSNHDLEQFAYIASHDLQEPLRKIQTFSSLLQEQPDQPELRAKYFPKITQAATRMSKLIKDVLNYSRLSQANLLRESIDLNQVLKEVLSEYDVLIEEKKARVLSGTLPVIYGVKTQLHQLFANLLSNALKFSTTAPEIQVYTLLPTDASALPHFACICIADNGIGFEQRYADRIFDIFKRLNNREQYAGTGVGLALCKKIMENHQGNIAARSEPGRGTTFYLYFPLFEKD